MKILNQTKFVTDLTWNHFYLQHNDNGQNNKMYFTSNDNIIPRQSDLGRSRLPSREGGGRQNQGDTAKENADFLHLFPPLWSLVPGYSHHLTRSEWISWKKICKNRKVEKKSLVVHCATCSLNTFWSHLWSILEMTRCKKKLS